MRLSLLLVGLIVFGGAVWFASTGSKATGRPNALNVAPRLTANDVASFLRFVDSANTPGRLDRTHDFTVAGIRAMAAAIAEISRGVDVDISHEADALRAQAFAIQRDPGASEEHAASARDAFLTLVMLLEATQYYSHDPALDLAVANVRRAAESIRPDEPLLRQADIVHEFFNRAAAAIRELTIDAGAPPPRFSAIGASDRGGFRWVVHRHGIGPRAWPVPRMPLEPNV